MNESTLEKNSRTLGEILRNKYKWCHLAFIDGMAPIQYRKVGGSGKRQVWEPKTKFWRRLFGASNGPIVPLDEVIKPGCFLKFGIPNETTQATMDYQNWRGYLDRDAIYDPQGAGSILESWVRFISFHREGFDFSRILSPSDASRSGAFSEPCRELVFANF